MEPMTVLVLAFQLLALFSIAGALLIYLICKVRGRDGSGEAESTAKPNIVLITSVDTALGLQLCTYLANKGYRVFAGMKEMEDSLPAKLLYGWVKMRECTDEPVPGIIVGLQLDVTREDMLREATIAMGAHMNAGERGIGAVINTSGSMFRGQVESQDVQQWEHMLKTNILGSLRVVKAFAGFLRPTRGRLIYLGAGAGNGSDGLVAFNAARVAVDKCAEELRRELQPCGVSVIALDTCGIAAEELYRPPAPQPVADDGGARMQYTADVLSANALQVIERALTDVPPRERYQLMVPNSKYNFSLPCRSSFRMTKLTDRVRSSVQRV